MKGSVQAPEQAFNQSRVKFTQLTGKQSPDIVLVASCMWCVRQLLELSNPCTQIWTCAVASICD